MKDDEWKQEYKKLFASPNKNDGEKANALKVAHLPDRLYRYRSFTSESMMLRLNEILSGEIYLSHPDNLNDPLEACSMVTSRAFASYSTCKEIYMACFKNELNPQQYEAIFRSDAWDVELVKAIVNNSCQFTAEKKQHIAEALLADSMREIANTNEHINQSSRNMMRMACFTTKADNLPMWSHYADSHKGICLEYRTSDITAPDIIARLYPVLYVEQLPDMMHLTAIRSIPNRAPEYLASHKLDDWKYENEWRLLYSVADFGSEFDAMSPEMWKRGRCVEFVRPSRIIIGLSMPDDYERMLRNLADRLGISVSKATKKEFGFEIV